MSSNGAEIEVYGWECDSGETAEGIFHFRMDPKAQPRQLVHVLVRKIFLSRLPHAVLRKKNQWHLIYHITYNPKGLRKPCWIWDAIGHCTSCVLVTVTLHHILSHLLTTTHLCYQSTTASEGCDLGRRWLRLQEWLVMELFKHRHLLSHLFFNIDDDDTSPSSLLPLPDCTTPVRRTTYLSLDIASCNCSKQPPLKAIRVGKVIHKRMLVSFSFFLLKPFWFFILASTITSTTSTTTTTISIAVAAYDKGWGSRRVCVSSFW